MKVRTLKAMALFGASGVLFQLVGCGGAISQLIVNQVITRVAVKLLDALLGSNNDAAA